MNLLILDDEKYVVEDMLSLLDWKSMGFDHVFTALNLKKAAGIMEHYNISVAICDIEMPNGDGFDFLRYVKDTESLTECIFLTCHMSFEYAQKALQLGVIEYILKPVMADEMESAVIHATKRYEEKLKLLDLEDKIRTLQQFLPSLTETIYINRQAPDVIHRAGNYIREHISEELSRDIIAEKLYINPDHLDRLFKKYQSVTTTQFILNERILLARRLLCDSNFSLLDISLLCGFGSASNFSNSFKKIEGISPREYRNQNKNENNALIP